MTHTHRHTDMDMKNNNHAMAAGASESNTTDDHTTPISCSSSSRVDDNKNKLYKGVRKRKWGKWVSEIRLPNSRERIWLGSHDSPEQAARAFDAALYCLRGRHANFNFPNTPCNMDNNVAVAPHQSLTPQEIQEVAAKFANQTPLLQKPLLEHGGGGNSSSFGGSTKMLCKSDSIAESTTTSTSTCTPTNTTASSCSTIIHECDGSMQVEVDHAYGDMDWTFLNVFDYSNETFPLGSDYDHLYSDELHKMHSGSGELLYSSPPPPPPPFQGYEELIEATDDDPFSHQSFLWNWNF